MFPSSNRTVQFLSHSSISAISLTMTRISMIVAALKPSYGIGFQGKMPWRLRQEIRYFKHVTSQGNNAVIMGRKTWELIPGKFRPLPDRTNVVLSREPPADPQEGVIYALSFDDALLKLKDRNIDNIFIIGGAQLYNSLANDDRITRIYLTDIRLANQVEMDTFLLIEWKKWKMVDGLAEEVGMAVDEITEGDYTYKYTLWERA